MKYMNIFIGAVAIGGGVYVVKKFTNLLDGFDFDFLTFDNEEKDKEELEDNKDKLNDLINNNVKPSYTDFQYKQMAKDLEVALAGIGNDEQGVADVFNKVKNEADVRKLSATFGMRKGENLNNWLKSDMISTFKFTVKINEGRIPIAHMLTIADMVREILKRKNISYVI